MIFRGIDTGHVEPPRKVDIPTALQNVGVPYYDRSRAYEVYLRYISGRYIYDRLSIRELQELCRDRRISLRNVPDIYPGPKSHPWVQESFRRLHTWLVELLERSEAATTFERFLDLEPGLRFKVYKLHYDETCDNMGFASFVAPPAVTYASRMVHRESLRVFFNRDFGLHTFTKDPSLHPTLLPAPPAPGLGHVTQQGPRTTRKKNASNRFLKAPPNYSNNIRRFAICRFVALELYERLTEGAEKRELRADCGTWLVDLDAEKVEKRVTWVAEAGHGDRYDEKGKKKIEKSIADATSRLQRCVDAIMARDGLLRGTDALDLRNAIENINK